MLNFETIFRVAVCFKMIYISLFECEAKTEVNVSRERYFTCSKNCLLGIYITFVTIKLTW